MADNAVADGHSMFADLTFTVVPNSALRDHDIRQIENDVTDNGGTLIPFNVETGHIARIKELTHIISVTSDFPDYHTALDEFIHVVKPTWIETSFRQRKAANPRPFSPDPALFLSEVVICCGDIPEGDKEAIIGGVIALGGRHVPSLSKVCTHLVALTADDERATLIEQKRLPIKVVLPHWFDDCLRVGARISEEPYTLPNPELLNVEATGPISQKPNPHVRDATTPIPTDIPKGLTAAQMESRPIQAFKGKKVMLSEDLNVNNRLRKTIEDMIKAGEAHLTTNVDEAHIYICNYRKGQDYVKASLAQKDVGNLSWLYYVIAHNEWTSPMRRMLHYPLPPNGIEGFKECKISVSNFTGDARIYLENLAKAAGAEFTKTFRQENTHLVTAHTHSEKCDAAKEWNVHVVNHLWLEESYARCKMQTVTDPRYIHFPPRTNLGEILGQTQIDRDAIDRYYLRPSKPKPKKKANVDTVPASSVPNGRIASDPSARTSPAAEKAVRRNKTENNVQTPAKRFMDDKENETPGTTGSRGAKDRAISKLHDAAPDIAQFEKEMKRKGGVIHGGKRSKTEEDAPKHKAGRESSGSKRSFDDMDVDAASSDVEEVEEVPKVSKKAKRDKKTPIKYRMLLSGYKGWQDNTPKESADKIKLRNMGIFIVDDPKNVDILCAPKIVRTRKFVATVATAPILVSTSFLDYALKHDKIPSPEKHLLDDPEFEATHGFRMEEALSRAAQNKKRLLKNWAIFCTESVTGGFQTYKDIIVANGGECHLWKGRTSVTVSHRAVAAAEAPPSAEVSQNQQEDEGDVLYLISEPQKKEFPLWQKFRELAEKQNMTPRIVKTEWVLFVAMAQFVHWDPEWELSEEKVVS